MRPGWLEAGALAVLGLSLALKLTVLDVPVDEDVAAAVRDLQTKLGGQGYAATVPRTGLPIVRAERRGCALTARVLDPQGVFQDTELIKLQPGWSVAYGWRGEWRTTMPRLAPLVEYYTARQLARFGLEARHSPVIMASLAPGCGPITPAAADLQVRLHRANRG